MSLPRASDTSRSAIVGKSGTGKSNAAKAWLVAELERGRRVVVFDPEDEYSRHGRETGRVHLGPCRDRVTMEELELNPTAILSAPDLSLSVVPSDDENQAAKEAETLVEFAHRCENFLLLFDEVGWFSFDNDEARRARRALNLVAQRGRHWGVPVVFVAQRLVHVPASARAQLTAVQTFTQTHPEDLRALQDLVGVSAPDFADDVPHLAVGEFKDWCDPLTEKRKP